MSRFAPVGERPTFLRALVYGAASTNPAALALSFPQPRVITFDPNIRFFGGPDVRVAFPERIGEIRELISAVRDGAEPAGTLVLYGMSRVWDAINYALRNESRDTFYRKRGEYISTIVRATENLPCHVVFVAREKAVYADPGTVVNGRTVSVDDTIAIGGVADLDRNTEYEVDLTLRITRDEASGVDVARVINSFWVEIPQGREIPAPSFADLATMIASGGPTLVTAATLTGDDVPLTTVAPDAAMVATTITVPETDPYNDLPVDVPADVPANGQQSAEADHAATSSTEAPPANESGRQSLWCNACGTQRSSADVTPNAPCHDERCAGAYVEPEQPPEQAPGDASESSVGETLSGEDAEHEQTLYEICAKCPFFIEQNDAGVMHLDDGEVEHDHEPEPSGDVRTLAQWQVDRPELFPPSDSRYSHPTVITPAIEGETPAQGETSAAADVSSQHDGPPAEVEEPAVPPEFTNESLGELFRQLRDLRQQRMGDRAENDARFATLSAFLQAKGVLSGDVLANEQRPLARKTIEDALEVTRSFQSRPRRTLTPPPHLRAVS